MSAEDTKPIIIKSETEAPPEEEVEHIPTKEEIDQIVSDAQEQASSIIQDAKQRAENIISQAEAKANQVHDGAYDEGYNEGKQAAKDEIEQQRQDLLAEANGAIEKAKQARAEIIGRSEKELIALSLAIAKKILDHEIQEKEIYVALIKNAIKSLQAADDINAKISVDAFKKHFADSPTLEVETPKGGMTVNVSSDTSLHEGDLLVETKGGMIDGGINTQMNAIERGMLGEAEDDFDTTDFINQAQE